MIECPRCLNSTEREVAYCPRCGFDLAVKIDPDKTFASAAVALIFVVFTLMVIANVVALALGFDLMN